MSHVILSRQHVGLLLVVVSWLPGAASAAPLGSLDGVVAGSLRLSPDGRRIAMVVEEGEGGGGRRMMIDGEPSGGRYDEIAKGMPIFSSDGGRVAFAASRGGKAIVVVDGIEYEAGSIGDDGWPVGQLVIAPHGQAVMWQVRDAGKTQLVINGRTTEAFDDAVGLEGRTAWGVLGLVFDPTGQCFAFRGVRDAAMVPVVGRSRPDPARPGAQVTVGQAFASIGKGSPIPVPGRGPHAFAFIACVDASGPKQPAYEAVVVFDGKPTASFVFGQFDEIGRDTLVWSPHDPLNVWFAARTGDAWKVVVRGKPGPAYDDVGPITPLPDGRGFHLARRGKEVVPVLVGLDPADRRELPGGEGVHHGVRFVSDGCERIAYVTTSPAGSRVVSVRLAAPTAAAAPQVQPSPEYQAIDPARVVLSADGVRLAFVAQRAGKELAVIDGVEGLTWDQVGRPVFSSDGARVAYRATVKGGASVVVDGHTSGPFDEIAVESPRFVPHSGRVVYAARRGPTWQLYVDGVPGPECERLVSRIELPDDGTGRVAYAARFLDRGGVTEAVVIDGRRRAEFDEVFSTVERRLGIDGTATFLGRRGKSIVRETIDRPGITQDAAK